MTAKRILAKCFALFIQKFQKRWKPTEKNRHTKANIFVVNGWESDGDFTHSFKEYVKDTFEDELADVMIRVMDLAAFKGINLEQHILAKMRFNAMREHKHGKKY